MASGDLKRLSSVWRYSSIPITCTENVAEHHAWVCIYASLIHQAVLPGPEHMFLIGPLCAHAISHDIPEALTGDIVRTFKYSDENLKASIDAAEHKIVENFPGDIQKLISSYRDQLLVAGKSEYTNYVETVVKMADFLSCWIFLRREVLRGNQEIYIYVNRLAEDLSQMAKSNNNEWVCTFYKHLELESRKLI